MKKHKGIFYRISSLLLVLLLLFCTASASLLTANAATTTKIQKSYEIAVVFDNSGSMYISQNKAWSRAKYAMEVFASMLDLNTGKDVLKVFPMHEIVTDGTTNGTGSKATLQIRSKQDIDKLHYLYTPKALGTPYATVNEAYADLQKSSADERWLLILTDGRFDGVSTAKLQKNLEDMATGNIKVQYLGIGATDEIKPNEGKGLYSKKSSDTSLKDDLVQICNQMFQRSELKDKLSGQKLTLDISMSKIIVFAQGNNAKITKLKNSSGKAVSEFSNSGQRKFSEAKFSAGQAYEGKCVTDTTLSGVVVTYTDCPKGEYTLEHSGAERIQIFYEPDVDIAVSLINSDGEELKGPQKELIAGEYTVKSRIIDRQTKEDVTDHPLMGNDVNLKTYIKASQDGDYTECKNGEKVNLEPDSSTEILIKGTYLKDFRISSKDSKDLDWLKNIKVVPQSVDFKVNAEVTQSGAWYKLSNHSEWEPIKVTLTADGQPLTDEKLLASGFTVKNEDGLKYRCEPVMGESAYKVYIAQDENGKYVKPETGKYKLKFSAEYVDEYGKKNTAEDDAAFEIQIYSKFWRWLLWILIIAAIIAIICAILNYPTLPSAVYLKTKKTCQPIKINGSSMGLSTDYYPGELKCEAKACTPLKKKGSTNARFEVKNIKPIGSVNWFEIDGYRFKKSGNRYVNDDGETVSSSREKIIVSDETELRWHTNRHNTVTGRIYINHND